MIHVTSTHRPCSLQPVQPVLQQQHRVTAAHCIMQVGACCYTVSFCALKRGDFSAMGKEKAFGFPIRNTEFVCVFKFKNDFQIQDKDEKC